MIQQLFQFELENQLFVVFEYHEISLDRCNPNLMDGKDIVNQLVNVIEYLQSSKIVLVNLNPSNIFVVEKSSKMIVKITNFTRAVELNGNSVKIKGNLKLKEFAPPEITKNKIAFLSSDIYSLGCVFFFMFSGGLSIHDIKFKSHQNILERNQGAASPNYTDVLCADLIQKLVPYKHAERLTTEKIKAHPLFWSPQDIMNFFIEIAKLVQTSSDVLRKALYKDSNTIVGDENEDWTVKVDKVVMQELYNIRSDFKARSGTEAEVKFKKNILSLIRVMRNIIVHTQAPALDVYMGTPEKFVNYWLTRFPGLLLHVYNAKEVADNHAQRISENLNHLASNF